ncbi:biogenesis of lysosome-related organelles complex 1 subunit 6 isoform X1 [Latimeria chalumnae]|uniref:biogenesis of lysosome-related organelles complex 1 subunit 6 isoform X1 n=1 Tax=Latimeria chalumnae TaxID=7897 RepID=UPI00313AD229
MEGIVVLPPGSSLENLFKKMMQTTKALQETNQRLREANQRNREQSGTPGNSTPWSHRCTPSLTSGPKEGTGETVQRQGSAEERNSDSSPDSRPEEELIFDKDAVEKLTEGLISYYVPDLQRSRLTLQELTQNQGVVLDTLEQEISKFRECHSVLDINALFTEAKHYHNKLVNIRKDMIALHEKTIKLKKKALKLQQQKQKEELEREQQREKELERERQLIARPAKRT